MISLSLGYIAHSCMPNEHSGMRFPSSANSCVLSNFIGCELSSEVPFYTFQADEDEDLEHFLELRTVSKCKQ